jgi:hypothetical protein
MRRVTLKRTSAVAVVIAAITMAGCYGSTEPATDVRPNSAVLQARGTANDGPAFSYFELGKAWTPPQQDGKTPTRTWPAGASGPISERVTGLEEATDYRYRVCGNDAGKAAVCANTRSFTTPGPDGVDSVIGFWRAGFSADPTGGSVRAIRDTDGANPRGNLSITTIAQSDPGEAFQEHRFTGFVTCLRIDGVRATVGAVGAERVDGGPDTPYTAIASFRDEPGGNGIGYATTPGSTPPNCGTDREVSFGHAISSITITDH